GGRYEGERGHNHFITGLDLDENGRHFERSRAGMGEEDRTRADEIGEPSLASLGERSITCQVPGLDGLSNMLDFLTSEYWPIEWYCHRRCRSTEPTTVI